MKIKYLTVFLIFAACCAVSCKTVSVRSPDAVLSSGSVPLESGAVIYILSNIEEARPVIDLLPVSYLKDKYVSQMIDNTTFAITALFPAENDLDLQIAAWGNYPSSSADIALGANAQWRKQKPKDGGYWYSPFNGISLVINKKRAFIASSMLKPVNPITTGEGVKIPEDFLDFYRSSAPVIGGWFDNPSPLIALVLNNIKIPVRIPADKLFLSFIKAEDGQYQTYIRFKFESPSMARGVTAMLTLAGAAIPQGSSGEARLVSLFFAVPPVQIGQYMDIKSAPLSEEDLSLLFRLFSLQ
jgi:hypothetical protein